jgi:glutathione S-transferase
MTFPRNLNVFSSVLASQLRGWGGAASYRPAKRQPAKPLELYDIEASPYCRLVREALTELDLDVMIYPCPARGTRFRPKVKEIGGKHLHPFLVDPNNGTHLYESADIIDYVRKTYDGRVRVATGLRRKLAVASSMAATIARSRGTFRSMRGVNARPSKSPAKPLELFSFEASPFSRPVREVLCELEIPYLLRNTGKGHWKDMGPPSVRDKIHKSALGTTRNRKLLAQRTGRVQVPYLIDPNGNNGAGIEMYESKDIVAYLEKTYAA